MLTALLFATVIWWLFPIIIVLQKTLNPGPVFYRALRAGLDGKPFICFKLRTMIPISMERLPSTGVRANALQNYYATRFGMFLRKTNLDELPQFWNVVKGDMSIVGPRPYDVQEHWVLTEKLPLYCLRSRIRPGITGWAQVNGYHSKTDDLEHMQIRTRYDVWYIDHRSFMLDMKIVIRTAINLLRAVTANLQRFPTAESEFLK